MGLQTSAGNSTLGSDDDVMTFDNLRFKLKDAKRAGRHPNKALSLKYKEVAEKMRCRVLSVKASMEKELTEMEQKHFRQHGKLPAKIKGSKYYNCISNRNLAIGIHYVITYFSYIQAEEV